MKREQRAHLSTKNRARTTGKLKRLEQIERQLQVLLLLVQHNIDKLLRHTRAR